MTIEISTLYQIQFCWDLCGTNTNWLVFLVIELTTILFLIRIFLQCTRSESGRTSICKAVFCQLSVSRLLTGLPHFKNSLSYSSALKIMVCINSTYVLFIIWFLWENNIKNQNQTERITQCKQIRLKSKTFKNWYYLKIGKPYEWLHCFILVDLSDLGWYSGVPTYVLLSASACR